MKEYDLEERVFLFAKNVREFTKRVPKTVENIEDIKQLTRASGSVGGNYLEANGSLGKRDFQMRLRISRKESKESRFFLRLIHVGDDASLKTDQTNLIQEARELMCILSSILKKTE